MFYLIFIVFFVFLLLRFVRPLDVSFRWKIALTLLLLVFSQQRLLNRFFAGSIASPELPTTVLVVQGFMFSTFFLLTLFVLLRDLLALLTRLWYKPHRAFSSLAGLSLGLLVAAVALSVFGVGQAIRVPDVRTVEIPLKNLPPQFDGFRIAQVSDIHASRLLTKSWVRALVEKTNALAPDLVLLTGDMVDGAPIDRAEDVAPLADFRGRYGVLAVTGNHEYYSNFTDWMAAFKTLGLRVLQNEHVLITHQGASLIIAGTTDQASLRFGLPPPNLTAALAGAPQGLATILLEHQPANARANAAAGVDLQLSGHTHGGQIIGLHVVPQYVNKGFVSGLYELGAMRLYVSNGAGLWNGFPVRLGRPSEITEIILRRAPSIPSPIPSHP